MKKKNIVFHETLITKKRPSHVSWTPLSDIMDDGAFRIREIHHCPYYGKKRAVHPC
ncbi:hypothetical protein SAMN04488137_0964 [Fictibacillus solisalsi]|uniref:Uncharacterized protein n=1 Tax=Fictibacillus solisalsi TaxID=459525 RepID=A0A1G9UKN9_9BACL|nr:hypothetical protein SAMN04488137_0964 [Fictibacillus solisalsi]